MTETLPFYVYERLGSPIYPKPQGDFDLSNIASLQEMLRGTEIESEDLRPYEGQEVIVPTFHGYTLATLVFETKWFAKTPSNIHILSYNQDHFTGKSSWVSLGSGNFKGLKKVQL